jgi:hypothetical protein
MCHKQQEIRQHVTAAIEREGATITGFRITGGTHQRLDFTVAGRAGFFFFASTPRQGKNAKAIATARRVVRRTRENGA